MINNSNIIIIINKWKLKVDEVKKGKAHDSRQINKQTNVQCNEQQPEVESADDDNNDYDENENENVIECEKQKLSQKFIKIHQSK